MILSGITVSVAVTACTRISFEFLYNVLTEKFIEGNTMSLILLSQGFLNVLFFDILEKFRLFIKHKMH